MKTAKLLMVPAMLVSLSFSVTAQKKASTASSNTATPKPVAKASDQAADEKKVRDMVAFFQYMLNTLGSNNTPTRDKDVLITESYSKIFRDSKVQIEDDLDDERAVITNKDIVAYLKDVNFFFKEAKFEFNIENIEKSLLPSGEVFYKVSAKRNLTATTLDRKTVNNIIPRFIEINYNPKEDDLKIVSIYTSGIDEKRALTNWWNELSYEWQNIFKRKLNLAGDSVRLSEIKSITAITELDLSNNTFIQDIGPIGQLSELKSLNLSGANVQDLSVLRNLTELEYLNLANTKTRDLTPLKYSTKIEQLNLSHTKIHNISVIEKMVALKSLELAGTNLNDFSPISQLSLLQKVDLNKTNLSNLEALGKLKQLDDLDLSNTRIQSLNFIEGLTNLKRLNADSTNIGDLTPLSSLQGLEHVSLNFTRISNLIPLHGLSNLERVYCDQTSITQKDADIFRAENPKVLVIFDSNDLKIWWESIGAEWQGIFQQSVKIGPSPAKEELAKVQLLDSLNISGLSKVKDLSPLKKLPKLKTIIANKTNINEIEPIQQLKEVTYLDISFTKVNDISALRDFRKLKILKAEGTPLKSIEYISLPGLKKFYADQSGVSDWEAKAFLERNSECLIVYKSDKLKTWWESLSFEWREIFKKQSGDISPSTENLHALVEQGSFHIQDASITNLSGLREFIRLETLSVSGSLMNSITPLNKLTDLKSLKVSGTPLREIDSIFLLSELEELDLSNTPLEDIYPVWRLKNLKRFNCSGTQIKHLDVLERLESLEYLDCSNTRVSKLNALDYLPLKILKCYNTKLSSRSIESFKAVHPKCEVMYYR